MLNQAQITSRLKALRCDTERCYADFRSGRIDQKAFDSTMDRAEREHEKLSTAQRSLRKAWGYASNSSSAEFNRATGFKGSGSFDDGGFAEHSKTKQVGDIPSGGQQVSRGLSPADLDATSMESLYAAMQSRNPLTITIKSAAGQSTGFASYASSKSLAASPVTEGIPTFSGLLPPIMRPDLYTEYLYDVEPRISDFLPTVEIQSQEIALPVEGRPTNPTVPTVSELGTLNDAGLNWTTETFRPIKLAVLGSLSVELLDDASIFQTLVPKTLSNALFSAEADQILYGDGSPPNMTGIANTGGILALPASAFMYEPTTDTLIDAIVNASAVLRETPNFYQPATLILLNPSDWSGIRRIKNSLGDYVLSTISPNTVLADLDNIMGIKVVVSTHVRMGEAFILNPEASMRYIVRQGIQVGFNAFADTFWGSMEVGWRVFQRSVLAVTRPQGVIHMTSLGGYDGS